MNPPSRTQRRPSGLRTLARTPEMLAGILLLAAFTLLAIAHPLLLETVWDRRTYHPLTGYDPTVNHPAGPSWRHPLGTDSLGRDVLSMLGYATRSSLTVAAITATATGIISFTAGTAAAVWRGRTDTAISQLADTAMLLPAPIVMIAIGLARPGLLTPLWFGITYGLLAGTGAATHVVRSHALQIMTHGFIDAARIAGGTRTHIVRHHLTPHLIPLAAIQTMLATVGAIITAGFVDYMTPGTTDQVSYGSLIYSGLTYQDIIFWTGIAWTALLAGALAISLLSAAFYLIARALRQTTDTRR